MHDVLRSPGTPLDHDTRQTMEGLLETNLGDVRVHTDARAAASPGPSSALQRACACGGTSAAVGRCAECEAEHTPVRHAPNDVAGAAPGHAPRIVHEVLASASRRPLEPGTRAEFETRFGTDLGSVRIHTGDRAAASARAVNALAYTVGSNIVFGRDGYRPDTETGRRLIAHELTHVTQQEGTRPPSRDTALPIGPPDSNAEREAHAVASATMDARIVESLPCVLGSHAVGRVPARRASRASERSLQRHEWADSPAASSAAKNGNWTTSDRTGNTDRWKAACLYNLTHRDFTAYRQIAERRDFYRWFYEATTARGFETRWALAAHIVAGGMQEIASVDWLEGPSPITNELQGLTRIGNQVIFDDVLPKLAELWEGPTLTGAAARHWDEQVLAEEQNLIEGLYRGLSADTMARFKGIANMTYWRAQIGARLGGDTVAKGPSNREGKVPTFAELVPGGDINTPEGRWRYGMALAGKFANLPDYGYSRYEHMPAVGSRYTSTEAFDELNRRPHLHMLDAIVNDADISEDQVVAQLKALNPDEQRAFFWNFKRAIRIGHALSYAEMKPAIEKLPHMPIAAKLSLLGYALTRSWTSIDYSDLRPMILLAAKDHPDDLKELHTLEWRKVFLDVCDDHTIDQAVSDIQLEPAKARAWASAEKAWL